MLGHPAREELALGEASALRLARRPLGLVERRAVSLRGRIRAATGDLPGAFWALWWGFLVNRAATFVAAFLAIYLVRERGFEVEAAGRVVALYGLGTALAAPVGGALADRYGRRATMVGGLLGGALTIVALALARAPALLAVLAFLAATCNLYAPAANAAVVDVVPPPERSRAWGLVYWAVNMGMSVGLLLGGLFADRNLPALFVADAATTAAFGVIVLRFVPETRPAGLVPGPALAGLGRAFRDGPFATFLLLHLGALLVFTQWLLGLPLDMAAHGLGPSVFSVLMAANCLGVVVLQPLVSPRLRRHDGAHLLAASALLIGLGFGVNALGGSLPVYAVGTALWTVGEVVGFPVAAALVAELAPPELRGRYQGAFSMTWGLTMALSPILGGEIFGRWGGRTLWLACLALAAAVALGHLAAGGPRRRRLAARREEAVPGGAAAA